MKLRTVRTKTTKASGENNSPATQRTSNKKPPPLLTKKVSFSEHTTSTSKPFITIPKQQQQPPSPFLLDHSNTTKSRSLTNTSFPRASPPANAFPSRSFLVSSKRGSMHRYNSSSDSSSSSDYSSDDSNTSSSLDDDEDSDNEDSDNDSDHGAFPTGGPTKSKRKSMNSAALLLLSVSPNINPISRPRSQSLMEPLESLAGLASLDSIASINGARTGSINKLHACLSGLSRGSQANYGSLASFNNERSLYNTMAPQSYLLAQKIRKRERKKLRKKKKKMMKRLKKKRKKAYDAKNQSNNTKKKKRKRSNSISSTASSSSSSSMSKLKKIKRIKKSKKWGPEDAAAKSNSELGTTVFNNPACPPSLMQKFGKIYNTFGRVGIYTPQQRLLIMNRYRTKRTNRQWKKVVRYDCRKNLADTRLRIKGRFVRRDSEEAKAYFNNLKKDLDKKVMPGNIAKVSVNTNGARMSTDDSALGMKSNLINTTNSKTMNSNNISSSSSSSSSSTSDNVKSTSSGFFSFKMSPKTKFEHRKMPNDHNTNTIVPSNNASNGNNANNPGNPGNPVQFILPRSAHTNNVVNSTATLMDPGVAALPVAGGGFVRRPRAVSSIY